MASKKRWGEVAWLGALGALLAGVGFADPAPTTPEDFVHGGSQPLTLTVKLQSADVCLLCHANYNEPMEPGALWSSSMMGQAGRDPVFHATRAIALQDADNIGAFCNRCHSPQAFMGGRTLPTDGSAFTPSDFDGVSCSACHRMVDPVYRPGISPVEDQAILQDLTIPPVDPGNGNFVFDPLDRRRGPFTLDVQPHDWLQAAFYRSSAQCATCHEVSNPAFNRQPDGTYVLNALNQRHPTDNQRDMMPEQRTYSEWLMSSFATTPQPLGPRYGTNTATVQTCQDCHMPKKTGWACDPSFSPAVRDDYPQHFFAGSNTWVLKAVRALNNDLETNLTPERVDAAVERNHEMLRDGSDLELSLEGPQLKARIVNQTGHKLPTGYPEGRRMWINVRYFGVFGQVVGEHGAYDSATAVLTEGNTKVYEMRAEITPATAAVFAKPAGPYHGLIPVDRVYKDNRIPPRGFTNANFASIQMPPVGYSYSDGQYWDDTLYDIPAGAVRAEVRVFYQTTSREYIEFLRDNNQGGPGNAGEIAYNQWLLQGKSAPAEMDMGAIRIACYADLDDGSGSGFPDGGVDINDLLYFLAMYEAGDIAADVDDGGGNGVPDAGVDINDLLFFLAHYEAGC